MNDQDLQKWLSDNWLNLTILLAACAAVVIGWLQLGLSKRSPKLVLGVHPDHPDRCRISRSEPAREIHDSLNKYSVPIYLKNTGTKAAESCKILVRPFSVGAYPITANRDKGQNRDLYAIVDRIAEAADIATITVRTPIYPAGPFELVTDLAFIPSSGKYQQSDPIEMVYSWELIWDGGSAKGNFTVDYSGWNFDARRRSTGT